MLKHAVGILHVGWRKLELRYRLQGWLLSWFLARPNVRTAGACRKQAVEGKCVIHISSIFLQVFIVFSSP